MTVILSKREANLSDLEQVVRTDSPFELKSFNQSDMQKFAVPGTAETLQVATVSPVMLISLAFHPASNVTVNVLRVE